MNVDLVKARVESCKQSGELSAELGRGCISGAAGVVISEVIALAKSGLYDIRVITLSRADVLEAK